MMILFSSSQLLLHNFQTVIYIWIFNDGELKNTVIIQLHKFSDNMDENK